MSQIIVTNEDLRPARTSDRRALSATLTNRGFNLIELVVVIAIIAVLAAFALSRYANLGQSARAAAINGLAGSANSAVSLIRVATATKGNGIPGTQPGITFVTLGDGTQIRLWNGYPDRWCDGIGLTQLGSSAPSGGCYLSAAPVSYNSFTFYGYGSSSIPNGDAGWRMESAPSPINCAVGYNYNGTGIPQVYIYTSGC